MKKAILIVCVLALLVTASAAFAGDGSRVFLAFRSGWYDGATTQLNSTASFGASTAASTSAGSLGATNYNIVATNTSGGYYVTQKLLGTVGGSYTFTLVVAPGTGAAVSDHVSNTNEGKCYISAWNLDNWAGTTASTLPTNYKVTISGARVNGGTAVVWNASQLAVGAAPATTGIGPVGFWYDYGSSHYGDFGSAYNAGQTITVTVAPAPPDTPEPGSLLALGSGMMGLVGFAIRRRRA